jgi:hypothetical protein
VAAVRRRDAERTGVDSGGQVDGGGHVSGRGGEGNTLAGRATGVGLEPSSGVGNERAGGAYVSSRRQVGGCVKGERCRLRSRRRVGGGARCGSLGQPEPWWEARWRGSRGSCRGKSNNGGGSRGRHTWRSSGADGARRCDEGRLSGGASGARRCDEGRLSGGDGGESVAGGPLASRGKERRKRLVVGGYRRDGGGSSVGGGALPFRGGANGRGDRPQRRQGVIPV